MTWMILMPSEAEKVRDALSAARHPDVELLRKATLTLDARNELDVSDDVLARIERRSKDWRSPCYAAFRAILSASDRH